MPAHPEQRTASFPAPAELEAWRAERPDEREAMLSRALDVTALRRSAATPAARGAAAEDCLRRARDWRARGGKVACAFGKVVCDQAVPRDGGPAHADMKDWLNHTIASVRGSDTLLLIKPHPHELRNEIATFLTEHFIDLVDGDLPDNVALLGHDWFTIREIAEVLDVGVVYNGTTAVELGILGVPTLLCSRFAPIDYPVGHPVPRDREHYRRMLRFEEPAAAEPDLRARSAAWLHYLGGDAATVDYRYHARGVTNRRVYPPWWFAEDIERYAAEGDPNVRRLAERIVDEPPARRTAPVG